MNGNTPEQGWQGLFNRGEKVRLRFINSAAMTIFDVRIPGLKMTVVTCDGQNIQPVSVDEFRIGVAETYDVIVEPESGNAYCIFAQSIDRTGFVYGSLTSDSNLQPEIPAMDAAPTLAHRDMGMAMGSMEHGSMDHSSMDMSGMAPKAQDMPEMVHSGMDMDGGMVSGAQQRPTMDHNGMKMSGIGSDAMDVPAMVHNGMAMSSDIVGSGLGLAGFGSHNEIKHVNSEYGPHVDMRADNPQSGLHDPGIGLREHQRLLNRKVLTYADIKNLYPTYDKRQPNREIQLHLTGSMNRYMWSMNGIKFADAAPLNLTYGERVRITLVNDTMMTHPMHLHGMWSELETGEPGYLPRKHTVLVQPGSKISYLVTADALGAWAYHCHLLFHMPGMFRKVVVK